MSSPSNLYAEKIFSEHPTSLWALDDRVDYLPLIKESDRTISLWEDNNSSTRSKVSGGTAQEVEFSNEPFANSTTTLLTGNLTSEPFGKIECISIDALGASGINFSQLSEDKATFSIGTYIYTDSAYLSGVELGFEYYDSVSGENVQILKTFNTSVSGRWIFISETFDTPNDNSTMRIVLNIIYSGGADNSTNYMFYVNGLSVGQWSENFNSTSLGSQVVSIPQDIAIDDDYGVEAKAYGLQESSGYYLLSSDGSLTAKNSSIPLVYGSSNVTILSPNDNKPSLIVPGSGFLNESGKYKDCTVEFWTRLSCDSYQEKRIFGPIASDDGLYVRGPFITLKIGDVSRSHYIGEWVRPMLINIRYSQDSAELLINGEEVFSMPIRLDLQSFPEKLNSESKNQDWLGFYAYDDVSPLELDCVAIYPYHVSQILAKRRWIYGQGVEFPENINTAYSGTSVFIDYPFANYSNNYSYPDIGKWEQGVVENLVSENGILSLPKYSLPSVVFDNKTSQEWIDDLSDIQNESNNLMCLKPKSSWSSTNGYILIDNLNIINNETKAFYGVFKQKEDNLQKQVLFEIKDVSTSNYFEVSISNNRIYYILKYGNSTTTIYSSQAQYFGQEFSVGINIRSFVEYFGGSLPLFFGKKSSLQLFVGGSSNFENTFSGNIYAIGLCTERNLSKIAQFFSGKGLCLDDLDVFGVDGGIPTTQYWLDVYSGGLPDTSSWDLVVNPDTDYMAPASIATVSLLDFVASYTLNLKNVFDVYKLSISVDSYWEDYIPLTYLAKYVKDANDYPHYEIDFIQFNVNYPAPSKFVQEESFSSWTYEELREKFSVLVQRTYESLDNQLFTGYDAYSDLSNNSFKSYKYDTSESMVKTYITFQYLAAGANAPASYFTNTVSLDKDGTVVPGSYVVGYNPETEEPIYDNFENTKYEVVDNTIIYPPSHVDFNELAIVTHMEMAIDGIDENPVMIKTLQYASQALNDTTPNKIGTRFGTNIYPYKKSGVYLDYKSPNPFSIYKGSSPYLYLTRNSGIRSRGKYDPLVNRGIQIPINESKADGYKVIAAQMAVRYDEDFFPYAPVEIFQIESKKSLIKIYMVANHPNGKRAKIYAVNAKTGRLENGIAFYWNGKIVKEPNITIKEWGMLGISFSNSLNFESYSGAIRITGPLLVNTISHYKSTNLQEVQQITNRPWFKVKAVGALSFDWDYWNTSYIWNGVLVISSTSYYGVSPEEIYKTYTGTNKIIVDDERPFSLGSYQYRFLDEVVWQGSILDAI
jgi:hypothetical protein